MELVKDEAILQELGQWVTDLQNAEIKLGFTKAGRPLHVQCSYPIRPLAKIITLYEPDPELWIDFRVRR